MIINKVISCVSDDYAAHVHLLEKYGKELEILPIGTICIKNINGKDRYYHYIPSNKSGIPGKQVYIKIEDEKLIRGLCRRKFIEAAMPRIKKIIRTEKHFLESYSTFDPLDLSRLLPKKYQNIDCGPISDMVEKNQPIEWVQEPYEKKTSHSEGLIYKTQCGLLVRSKSELIIANLLELNKVPFRYEAAIELDGKRYHPDFTILNPQDNQVVYWEHFGLADNADYTVTMEHKIRTYKKHGICQWNNLIVTYESKDCTLDVQKIRSIVRAFLLCEI